MRTNKAFTLLELLITLAIITILLAIGAPSLRGLMQNNNAASAASDIQKRLLFARNHSVSTLNRVTVCPLNNTNTCTTNWISGIDVFIDHNGNRNYDNDDQKLVKAKRFTGDDTFNGILTGITFMPNGSVSSAGTFEYCSGDTIKLVNLNINGKSKISDSTAACH